MISPCVAFFFFCFFCLSSFVLLSSVGLQFSPNFKFFLPIFFQIFFFPSLSLFSWNFNCIYVMTDIFPYNSEALFIFCFFSFVCFSWIVSIVFEFTDLFSCSAIKPIQRISLCKYFLYQLQKIHMILLYSFTFSDEIPTFFPTLSSTLNSRPEYNK